MPAERGDTGKKGGGRRWVVTLAFPFITHRKRLRRFNVKRRPARRYARCDHGSWGKRAGPSLVNVSGFLLSELRTAVHAYAVVVCWATLNLCNIYAPYTTYREQLRRCDEARQLLGGELRTARMRLRELRGRLEEVQGAAEGGGEGGGAGRGAGGAADGLAAVPRGQGRGQARGSEQGDQGDQEMDPGPGAGGGAGGGGGPTTRWGASSSSSS